MQAPDNFSYVVPVDYTLHTPDKPFCDDQTCACHGDNTAVSQVSQYVQDGLMTSDEATLFVSGRTF